MGDITFEFNIGKLIHSIAFFSCFGIKDLTKLKLAKLLYFADKEHLLSRGYPILGDIYFCMDYGPVPSFALNEMNQAISKPELPVGGDSDYSMMNQVLRVKRPIFGGEPRFEAKLSYDKQVFAETELNALKSVCENYGKKSARVLVDLSHKDPTYTLADKQRKPHGRTPIPYELFFEGAPESRKYLARLKADFCGEVIPLESDKEYSDFSASLLSYSLEPDFDLDSEQIRNRKALET